MIERDSDYIKFLAYTSEPSSSAGLPKANSIIRVVINVSKCQQLFAKSGTSDYLRSAKHAAVAYDEHHCC